VILVLADFKVKKESKVILVVRGLQALRASKVKRDCGEILGKGVRRVKLVFQGKQVLRVILERMVFKVNKEIPVLQVSLVKMVRMEQLVLRVSVAFQE
jgi:hypothetical protein